ncbi:CaiB/BaiF CoA transferase family protein [Paracandidimonas soli]|uniref:Formyl-CoA transferase n=1 Tax=Paracandidimonas soli TaxID=1917182 RepID=A0A4R3V4Q2_9BURK|nr:CoA transferase [Paracandidimonas soli]TCU97284.1 formyl-CoA transferase [Paracandidimonas soli]
MNQETLTASALPLSGVRVLDLTRVRAGPTAIRQLADWGADVIKIEEPVNPETETEMGGMRLGPDYQNLQRNKRSITLNLKDPEGVALFKQLVKDADVVAENYRPDVKTRLGIDYETLRAINPRLIYASISGFGQDGPYARRPGYDQIVQGMGGLMSITGLPGQGPVRAGIAICDTTAGLYAAFGIVMALFERTRTNLGQWVQASLLESELAILDLQAARWLVSKEVPTQAGNNHPTMIPTGLFQAKDGYITLQVPGQVMWERFCKAMEREDWLDDPRFRMNRDRSRNRVELNSLITEIFSEHPREYWIERLNKAGIACGAVNSIDEAFADPQVRHLGTAIPVKHPQLGDIALVGQPIRTDRHRATVRSVAPMPGAHNEEILSGLGLDAAAIDELRSRHVI